MMQIIQSYFLFFTRCDVICDPLQYTRTGKCNLFVQHQILLTKQLFKHKDCFVFLHEIFWYFGNCVFFIPPRIILKWSLRMIRIVPRVRPHMSITTVLPNQTKNLHWSKTRLCSCWLHAVITWWSRSDHAVTYPLDKWHSYTYIYIYIYINILMLIFWNSICENVCALHFTIEWSVWPVMCDILLSFLSLAFYISLHQSEP